MKKGVSNNSAGIWRLHRLLFYLFLLSICAVFQKFNFKEIFLQTRIFKYIQSWVFTLTRLVFGGAKLSVTVIIFRKKFGPISYHWSFSIPSDVFRGVKMETSPKKWFNKPYPVGNYMFKVNNRNSRTRSEICSKLTMMTPGVVLVSLLLTLNIFYTLFWCFYC